MKFVKSHEDVCCDDAIRSIFDLNISDLNVYKKLKEVGESKVEDLVKIINKDRSTVYRSLQKLASCGLCNKKTKTIETGGYYHTYMCISGENVKKKAELCVDKWYESMKEMIELFDS